MLLNKRELEKLKEKWWKKDETKLKCEKPEDQSDGISIQNIGGVFIVIFVGIGMACITLVFEYWYYKYRKPVNKVVDSNSETPTGKFGKKGDAILRPSDSFGSDKGLVNSNPANVTIKSRYNHPMSNFRARF